MYAIRSYYDLEKDPKQLNNIINDPQYTNVISKLKLQLKKLMIKYGDDRITSYNVCYTKLLRMVLLAILEETLI